MSTKPPRIKGRIMPLAEFCERNNDISTASVYKLVKQDSCPLTLVYVGSKPGVTEETETAFRKWILNPGPEAAQEAEWRKKRARKAGLASVAARQKLVKRANKSSKNRVLA